ncbi:MAG: hypothetical protein H6505_02790 [Calditrichaeota bacterium]|nr:hypothetical protein [Calditrichota bacterium]
MNPNDEIKNENPEEPEQETQQDATPAEPAAPIESTEQEEVAAAPPVPVGMAAEEPEELPASKEDVAQEIPSPIPHPPSPEDAAKAAENLAAIAAEIKALDAGHLEHGKRNYKGFFDHAKEIGQLFKTLKPLPHDEREKLWLEFSALCDDVRATQNIEREELKLASLELRGKLEAQLIELGQQGPNAKYADDFNALADKMKAVRDEFSGTKEKPAPLIPKDREALWKLWKQTDDAIWQHRKAIRDENYATGKEHVAECTALANEGDPFDCHKKIKELRPWQRAAELSREQRNEIRKALDAAWDAAAQRIEGERAERKQQFEDWKERSSDRLSDWEAKLEKMRDFRVRLEEQIARLNEMEQNARTDEFADQVAGWREEKEAKLVDVDKNIASLTERIESVKKRLK